MFTKEIKCFDLQQTAESGQCFRWERVSDNTYRVPILDESIEVSQEGDRFTFSCNEEEFYEKWYHYFDLDTDYGDIVGQIPSEDSFLYEAAKNCGGIRILNQDLWEMMLSFVISQNNNIPRIKSSLRALCQRFDGFPMPYILADKSIEELSGIGLGYRDEYIIETAKYYVSLLESRDSARDYFSGFSYDSAMEQLQSVKGIGKKVANCICLFGLHYLDACPVDTWIRKVIDEDYNGILPGWMQSEWAGVYQQYVFYYKRSMKR